MENEQPQPSLVTLDEHDAAAVVAILMRAVRAGDQIDKDQETVDAANVRLAENNVILNKAVSALALFGIEKRGDENVWEHVRQIIGRDAYVRAAALARGALPGGGLLEHMGDDELRRQEPATSPRPVAVRDAILRHLRAVGETGTNVGEIKRRLADDYGMTVHEKTPGMTLYRLLKDGLARREGRTWYATEDTRQSDTNEKNTGADLA